MRPCTPLISLRKMDCAEQYGDAGKRGDHIRILSPPVPLAFRFAAAGHLLDAVERAVLVLQVHASVLGRYENGFFLCVTVPYGQRIAARALFTEYGTYLGAGFGLFAHLTEQAQRCTPDAVARIGRYLKG